MFLPLSHEVNAMTSLLQPSAAASTPPPPPNKMLKFGIDRILADDTPCRRKSPDAAAGEWTLHPLDLHSPTTSLQSTLSPGRCCGGCEVGGSRVPCSDCVSSLLRCCSVAAPTPTYPYAPLHYLPMHHQTAPHYSSLYSPELMHKAAGAPSSAGPATGQSSSGPSNGGSNKRKRSWSRAVFSNLQRKGLEKRFQLQKYITKPDRRQLAATLGLTDAQVKVWFQNRRMKWRHSKEAKVGVTAGTGAEGAAVTTSLITARPGVTPEGQLRVDDLNRRAADSTQLECPEISSDDDSDVDIEVTS